MNTSRSISRRSVLYGFGASIALPALEIMGGKTHAATSGQRDPGRLACFYIPGAINHYNWFPKDTGFDYTIAPSHEPLKHHRDRFSVLTSLSHIEGRISGHKHACNFLTGHNIAITPGVLSNTVSFDQVAAQYIGQTYIPSLALSWTSGVETATLSRNSLGVDIPATSNYRAVFDSKRTGRHEISVSTEIEGERLTAETMAVDIGRPNLEFDRLDLDDKTLSAIAAATGGRYAHITTADHLIDALERRQLSRQVEMESRLYWPPLLWTLFVVVLTAEWVLRRRYQLR